MCAHILRQRLKQTYCIHFQVNRPTLLRKMTSFVRFLRRYAKESVPGHHVRINQVAVTKLDDKSLRLDSVICEPT